MDRAHRIGQKRVVNVYRYFSFFNTVYIKQRKDTTQMMILMMIIILILILLIILFYTFFSTDQNYTSTNINDTFSRYF